MGVGKRRSVTQLKYSKRLCCLLTARKKYLFPIPILYRCRYFFRTHSIFVSDVSYYPCFNYPGYITFYSVSAKKPECVKFDASRGEVSAHAHYQRDGPVTACPPNQEENLFWRDSGRDTLYSTLKPFCKLGGYRTYNSNFKMR